MNKNEIKDQIEGHNRRNTELVKVLAEKGIKEDDEIDVEYHFWAFTQEDAVELANNLYEKGYIILLLSPVEDDEGISWNVEAKIRAKVNNVTNSKNSESLVNLANNYDSIYDGWGTSI